MELPQASDAEISVIYVDDEPALLEIAKIFLERADGIHVTTVDNTEDAIRMLADGGCDAIVSDYQMPGMDGISFLKYVRSTYGELPFLLFTGKGREEIVIDALNNGADYYVEKAGVPEPQFADLVHKIRRAVSRCRTKRMLRSAYDELESSYEQLAAFKNELDLREKSIGEMQQALRESERVYQGIFAYTGSATAILDDDMTIFLANSAFAELVGYTQEEINGRIKWPRFVHPDDLPRLTEYHWARRRDPKSVPEHYEFRIVDRFAKVHNIYMTIGLIPESSRSVASHVDITELKSIRDRLSLMGNVLDESSNEIYLFDAETLRFVQVNRGGRENLGYTAEELSLLTPVDLKPEYTYESFKRLVAPLLSGEKGLISFTTVHRRKDGSEYPVDVHLTLSNVVSPPVFVAVIIDITSRRKAEEKTRILRYMVDHASSAVTIHGLNGRFIYANERTLGMLGYTRDELRSLRLNDIVLQDTPTWTRYCNPEVKEEGESVFESAWQRKNGSTFPVFVHLSSARWGERSVLLTIADDITEWKAIEDELRESRKQLSFALDAAHDGLWDWDIAKGVAYFSPQYLRMLGYEPGEFATTYDAWWEYVHPDDRADAEYAIQKSIATQADFFREIRLRKKDGSYLWILARGRVMETDDEGQPVRMVGTHTDITERKQIEEALRLANRKLQLLSGITRHDILNQAMALNGYLTLTEEMNADPKLREYLKKMHRAAILIEQTIAFTREYEQLGRNEPKWISVQGIIADIAMGADIPVRFVGQTVEVFADPLLGTVFSNLMDNILRHAGGATEATVSCVPGEYGAFKIACEDDGPGVPDELKERIFERGYGSNTGLGLFFVREILSITGITIRECGTEGKGACFEIMVPAGGWRIEGGF